MLESPTGHPASRRALALLVVRLDEPWSIDRLARALGLSSRTLYRVLRRDFGVSPMSLLRRVRLARARSELETPGPEATVTNVALDCGFTHLGRFSQEYARQFGELPSETLWRGRRRLMASGAEARRRRPLSPESGRLVPAASRGWSDTPRLPVAGIGWPAAPSGG